MKRYRNILVVATSPEESRPVMERAVAVARASKGKLSVVSVAEPLRLGDVFPGIEFDPAEVRRQAEAERLTELEAFVAPFRQQIAIDTHVLTGTPFLEVIRDVLKNDRDLLLKAPEASDWLDRLLGSNDMHLLRKCPCAVWFVKPSSSNADRNIVAAVDVDVDNRTGADAHTQEELNREILEIAIDHALTDAARLHVVAAWLPIGEHALRHALTDTPEEKISAYIEHLRRLNQGRLERLIAEISAKLDEHALQRLDVRPVLIKGQARAEIPAFVQRIDASLVVMGTVGRTGIPGLLIGNTAESILYQINCSVFAIKPRGFTTPVTTA